MLNAMSPSPVGNTKAVGRVRFRVLVDILAAMTLSTCGLLFSSLACTAEDLAFQLNRSLGRGMSLGSALEAPHEGDWGVVLKSTYFNVIHDAGFSSVRIPIRWSTHALKEAPYTISPQIFARVDWAIKQALSLGMSVVIDMHHYEELYQNPDDAFPRLTSLWDQIATHYRDYSDRLMFELVNEPHGPPFTDERWQAMIPALLRTIRKTNPSRMIIIGPGSWNSFDHLANLRLPEKDRNLIVTFHYYLPVHFTHQQVPNVAGSDQWKNVMWTGTDDEREALRRDFETAAAWGRENHRPLYLGEFGTYKAADIDSRARWANAMSREAEKQGFSWSYWDFSSSSFGAFDPVTNSWREPLLQALMPSPVGAR